MAYVPLTSKNIGEIEQKIRAMETLEVESLGKQPKVTIQRDELISFLWGEHVALEPVLPAKWKTEFNLLRLKFSVTHTLPGDPPKDLVEWLLLSVADVADSERCAPPDYERYEERKHRMHISEDTPGYAEAKAWWVATKEAEARWRKTREDVKTYLDSCRSLNEALKLWPQLSRFVPEHLLKKVEQKTLKENRNTSEAMDALARIDVEAAEAAAIIARLSEGSKL